MAFGASASTASATNSRFPSRFAWAKASGLRSRGPSRSAGSPITARSAPELRTMPASVGTVSSSQAAMGCAVAIFVPSRSCSSAAPFPAATHSSMAMSSGRGRRAREALTTNTSRSRSGSSRSQLAIRTTRLLLRAMKPSRPSLAGAKRARRRYRHWLGAATASISGRASRGILPTRSKASSSARRLASSCAFGSTCCHWQPPQSP